jgi:hypothetical protein
MNALVALDARPLPTLTNVRAYGDGSVGATAPVSAPSSRATDDAPNPAAAAPPEQSLLPPRLVIELDQAAERFVQTLLNGAGETVRRYPDETQLAFSRGISAYMAAIARG